MDLSEAEFTIKYLEVINGLKMVFDSSEGNGNLDESIDELSGYNNAIVNTLTLLDEKYVSVQYRNPRQSFSVLK